MTDLTTIDAVKALLEKADTGSDTLIASMVADYSQWIRSYTNRDFDQRSYEIWRDGRDTTVMMVPQWPLASVSLVEVDGYAIPLAPKVGGYGYRFTDRMVVLDGGARFYAGTANVHIAFTAGFAAIPGDISRACAELVALHFKMKGDNLNWTSKSLAGETVTLNTADMPKSVATILKQYQNPVPL